MKKYGVNELRKMFLEFFESKAHLKMKSFSLVPHNDDSLLLINSGMAPLKPYFTGQEIPPRKRVTTCQKCIRTGDIENIGKTARHGTYFEMLGNFSFGDYFKTEAIHWAWEFLTEVVGLDPMRLYPSIYLDDEEAFKIWTEEMGIPADRITRFGKEDNFWEHGAGPCGPCSEIYYDRGEKYGCGDPDCKVGCECDRFMEVWNIVFSQFENDGKGNYTELKNKNIDTGMGLERLAVICQDVDSLFDVDTNAALLEQAGNIAGCKYREDDVKDVSLRIIADHVKSCTFMASDGITASNEGRGYVFRRLLRRASRHGKLLGIERKFLTELAETVISLSKDGYPELEDKKEMILRSISLEEDRFRKTLDQGLLILEDMEKDMKDGDVLSGEKAFKLYDTYGFPMDLTKEILEDRNITIDEEGFKKCMDIQKETARKARKVSNYMGADETVYLSIDPSLTTEFTGYDKTSDKALITALCNEEELVETLTEGENGSIITCKSPFYGTMGGQLGDSGIISTKSGVFIVKDTIHIQGGKLAHIGTVKSGVISMSEKADMEVDKNRRALIARNHTATHLLQKALRIVLGEHVEQAGSYVDEKYLRFDFTHFQAMTAEEIERVEDIVNKEIAKCTDLRTDIMTIDEARKSGAMALFGEKYGEKVRVVSVSDYSVELCGGTHASNTGEIQLFKITSESGISAGVRRIEALTSEGLIKHINNEEKLLKNISSELKTSVNDIPEKIESLENEIKNLLAENEKLKANLAKESMGEVQEIKIGEISFISEAVKDVDINELRKLGDSLKDKYKDAFIVLGSDLGDKAFLMATATDSAMKAGAHSGNLIKAVSGCINGGGGGRPNMAQAGGKNPAGIQEALKKAIETAKEQLS